MDTLSIQKAFTHSSTPRNHHITARPSSDKGLTSPTYNYKFLNKPATASVRIICICKVVEPELTKPDDSLSDALLGKNIVCTSYSAFVGNLFRL